MVEWLINRWNGADYIYGGAGNDFIFGGAGNDYLSGGSGADTFRFTLASDSEGHDVISDFSTLLDKISLDSTGVTAPADISA